jgi:hypothetical protein
MDGSAQFHTYSIVVGVLVTSPIIHICRRRRRAQFTHFKPNND